MKLVRKCPVCGNLKEFQIERSPDGSTTCCDCSYRAPHMNFYTRIPEEVEEQTTKEKLIKYLKKRLRVVQSEITVLPGMWETTEKQEERELLRQLIDYVEGENKL